MSNKIAAMKSDSQLGSAVKNALRSSDVQSIGIDLAEVALDSVMQDGVLKDIPVIGTMFGLIKAVGSMRDARLARKLIQFMSQLSSMSDQERSDMVDRLDSDEVYRGRVGERLLEIIDRLEATRKPEMLGKVFRAFAAGSITPIELHRLIYAVERIPVHEIDSVRKFLESSTVERDLIDRESTQALITAGLAHDVGGWTEAKSATRTTELFVEMQLDK